MFRICILGLSLHLWWATGNAAEYAYEGTNPPRYAALRATDSRPRLALVLGSGGRRGFAHAGVLRVLESEGIKPDLIVGVSIGSVIGALYAGGMSAADVEQLAMQLDLTDLRDLSWIHWGQVRGQKLENFVNDRVRNRPLESLGVRFAVVATRQHDGLMQIFNSGDTGVAVRASSAVPGRFYAVRIADVTYIDGDVASPVPVRAARTLGADMVIAVDISARVDNVPQGVPDEWLQLDRDRRKRIDVETKFADVLIHPDIGYFAGTSGNYRQRVIAAAAEATRAALPRIRAAMVSVASKRVPGVSASTPSLTLPKAASPAPSPVPPAAR
ncbi:MAG: patatin-like phospholipase family protein [Burkholderiales bacterium]